MCWNQEVSIAFAGLELALLLLIWVLPTTRQAAKYFTPLALTVIVVETAEAFIWLHPEPITSFFQNSENCHPLNHAMTRVALTAVGSQTIAMAVLASRTENGRSHTRPEALCVVKVLTVVYTVLSILKTVLPVSTHTNHRSGNFSLDNMPKSLYVGRTTCSYD